MATQEQGTNGSVFISYSRKDKRFVKKLNDALDNAGVHAWVDWEGIELASDWMKTITEAIENSDAFIYVISPDSLKSKVCDEELALCFKYNKKLIPVLYRAPEKRQKMAKELSATNWVYMRQEDNFKDTLPKLITSINTDLGWVQKHTKLLGRAKEWDANERNNSFLLTGSELQDAERWQTEASGKENRDILSLQAEFISASRHSADRRQRTILFGISFALLLSIVLSILALAARNDARIAEEEAKVNAQLAVNKQYEAATAQANAEAAQAEAEANEQTAIEKTILANSQRSAALAKTYQTRPGQLDISTLLAIDSWTQQSSFEAEDLIRSNISLFPLPVAQMKQDGPIFNIEWSPDYSMFVTGNKTDAGRKGVENLACVWRADTGEKVYCVKHNDDVIDALFSPDGQYLITGSADKSVRFWDATTGTELLDMRMDFEGGVLDLDTSEKVLAIGREDNYLTLYYFNKEIKPFDHEFVYKVNNVKQPVGISVVTFSPNGDFLAFGTTRGDVEFWQATNFFFYHGPKHVNSKFTTLAFSPDNIWLVSGGTDSLSRLTKRDGTAQHSILHGDWVEDVEFGPDSTWYVTVSDDNKVRVVETATGEELTRMSHSDFVQKVAVSPDGQWIAATGYDKVVRIWDALSGNLMLEFPLTDNGSALSFNKDGTRIIAADEDGTIAIWDISSLNTRVNYITFPEFAHEAHFTPAGDYMFVNTDDYHVWKIPANQAVQNRDGASNAIALRTRSLTYDMAISPDSKWLAVVENDNVNPQLNRAMLTDTNTKSQDGIPLEHGGTVTSVGFTTDSDFVITAGVDGLLSFWKVGETERSFDLDNEQSVLSLAISPVNDLVAAGLKDNVNVWHVGTRSVVTGVQLDGSITMLAFSKDGKWLAAGNDKGVVSLWQVDGNMFTRTGSDMQFSGELTALVFSPNGKWLVGGDSSGFAYIWDVASTQEINRIRHNDPVTSVSFAKDGLQLVTVSRKIVSLWDMTTIQEYPKDQLVEFACRHFTENISRNTWASIFGLSEDYKLICPALPEGNE